MVTADIPTFNPVHFMGEVPGVSVPNNIPEYSTEMPGLRYDSVNHETSDSSSNDKVSVRYQDSQKPSAHLSQYLPNNNSFQESNRLNPTYQGSNTDYLRNFS
jgi:hypothetical protein